MVKESTLYRQKCKKILKKKLTNENEMCKIFIDKINYKIMEDYICPDLFQRMLFLKLY